MPIMWQQNNGKWTKSKQKLNIDPDSDDEVDGTRNSRQTNATMVRYESSNNNTQPSFTDSLVINAVTETLQHRTAISSIHSDIVSTKKSVEAEILDIKKRLKALEETMEKRFEKLELELKEKFQNLDSDLEKRFVEFENCISQIQQNHNKLKKKSKQFVPQQQLEKEMAEIHQSVNSVKVESQKSASGLGQILKTVSSAVPIPGAAIVGEVVGNMI